MFNVQPLGAPQLVFAHSWDLKLINPKTQVWGRASFAGAGAAGPAASLPDPLPCEGGDCGSAGGAGSRWSFLLSDGACCLWI